MTMKVLVMLESLLDGPRHGGMFSESGVPGISSRLCYVVHLEISYNVWSRVHPGSSKCTIGLSARDGRCGTVEVHRPFALHI